MRFSSHTRLVVLLPLLASTFACADDPTDTLSPDAPSAQAPLSSYTVALSPTNAVVRVGDSLRFTATVRDSRGRIVTGSTVKWFALPFPQVSITSTGWLRAGAEGAGRVRAEVGTASAQVNLTVVAASTSTPSTVATVDASPATASIEVGRTLQLTGTVRDAAGNVLSGRTVTWWSANSAVAGVSGSGLVTAFTTGTTRVVAAAGGVTDTVALTVVQAQTQAAVASVAVSPATATLAPGGTLQLAATLRDAAGNVLTGRTVTWSSASAAVATVSQAGTVTALVAGTAVVSASSEGRTGSATITVSGSVTPPPTTGSAAFASSWSAAQGNTNLAQSDGGIWERLVCPLSGTRDKVLHVVSGSEAGWTRTPNVLRVTNRGQTGCGQVETATRIPTGRNFYVRLFARVENENQPNFHPVTLNCCGRIETALWAIQNPVDSRSYQSRVMFRDPSDAQVLWFSPVLDQKRWYRFEWFIEIVDPVRQTYRVWPRVYDMAGTLLHDASSFRRGLTSGGSLAEYYGSGGVARYQSADLFRRFGVGYEGTGGAVDNGRQWYYAEARVCLDGWCGGV